MDRQDASTALALYHSLTAIKSNGLWDSGFFYILTKTKSPAFHSDVSYPCTQANGMTETGKTGGCKPLLMVLKPGHCFLHKQYHSRTVDWISVQLLYFPGVFTNSYTLLLNMSYLFSRSNHFVNIFPGSSGNMTSATHSSPEWYNYFQRTDCYSAS